MKLINAMQTLIGTKEEVDKLNKNSIKKAVKNKEEITILLHGVAASYYRTMHWIIKYLKKNNICVVSLGYEDSDKTKDSALSIKKQINNIIKKTHIKKVNIIGISLGGLIARYYAEKLNGKKNINKLITIYTPIKEVTNSFSLILNRIVGGRPLEYNHAINKIKDNFSVKKHLAIYGKNDKIIGPQYPDKSLPNYVKQIPVKGGHFFVSFNKNAMKIALNYLNEK